MTDAASIADGFAAVSERWGSLNSLVHTIGPGDGYFEEMDDTEWDAAFALGTMSGRALDSRRAAHAARGRLGPRRDAVRTLHPAAEPSHRRLHGSEGGAVECHQEPVEKPCQGRHSGELRLSRDDRHGQLHREPQRHPRCRRPRRHRPSRRYDLDRQQLSSAVRPRPRRAARGSRLASRPTWRRNATAM